MDQMAFRKATLSALRKQGETWAVEEMDVVVLSFDDRYWVFVYMTQEHEIVAVHLVDKRDSSSAHVAAGPTGLVQDIPQLYVVGSDDTTDDPDGSGN